MKKTQNYKVDYHARGRSLVMTILGQILRFAESRHFLLKYANFITLKKDFLPLQIFIFSAIFALIIIISNFAVQFQIAASYLTYGALTYPLSFLLMDILSEKNHKRDVLKILRYGLILAFFPSLFISDSRIAIASICAFFISQPLDVHLFYYFKKRLPRLWWLRNNASTIMAQFFDTMIFFHIAFLGAKSLKECIFMALFDFSVKIALSLLNTPFFYALAIKARIFIFRIK